MNLLEHPIAESGVGNRVRLGLLPALGCLAVMASIGRAQTFTVLRSPGNELIVYGISGDGSTVAGLESGAFRWTRTGGLENLSSPRGGSALAANYDGSVVVGYSAAADIGFRATVWTDGGATFLPSIPNARFDLAYSVSDDGSVVAGVTVVGDELTEAAFMWTSTAGRVDLGLLPGAAGAVARGVSGDGRVIVGASSVWAFRWTEAEGMITLDTAEGAVRGIAGAVNYDGSVIVGSSAGHIFRWSSAGGMEDLGVPSSWDTAWARGVSADASVVVGQMYRVDELNNGIYAPFLWTRELGMVDLSEYLASLGLDLTGWTLTEATGVSADGRTIVGNGQHNGEAEGWVLTLTSCPADFNHDLAVNSQDFFEFLNAFFAGTEAGDFNSDGVVNSADVFDYLGSFFSGCS